MGIQIGSNGYLFSPPIGHSKGFFLLLMKGSCSISMTIFGRFLIKSFNYTFISLSALGSLQFPLIYRKMDAFDSRNDFSVQGLSLQIIDIFHFWVIIHDFSNIVHNTSELEVFRFSPTLTIGDFSELLFLILATLYNTSELIKSSDFHQHAPVHVIGDFSELSLMMLIATLYITPQILLT